MAEMFMANFYWEPRSSKFYWYGNNGLIYSAKSTNGTRSGMIDGATIQEVYKYVQSQEKQS
jgi:hypothetical protein